MYNHGMTTMSISEARAMLPELLDRVVAGDEVTITRHGRPVAVVVRPDSLRTRRADEALARADGLADVIEAARSAPLDEAPTLSTTRARELATNVATTRSRR
jgi:prevent-host-death family protein